MNESIQPFIANASSGKAIPCRIDLRHFAVKSAGALALSQRDPEGHPLVERKEDAARELPVSLTDQGASLTLPARSVTFARLGTEPTPSPGANPDAPHNTP